MIKNQFLKSKICHGTDYCNKCLIGKNNLNICPECDYNYSVRCIKRYCNLRCSRCGAGKKPFKEVFGVCGRTTLLSYNRFIDLDWLFKYEVRLPKSSTLNLKTKYIPIIDRDIIKLNIPEVLSEIDAWGVQLHDVYNLKKNEFISRDIKDYLKIAKNTKLILSTNSTDDYQEILWQNRFKLNFTEYNFDYWFPGHFSIYDNDNKLYQFLNAKRQQIHAELSNSQFVWFRLGENIPLDFMKPLSISKNILFSTNSMVSEYNIRILQNEVSIADDFLPIDAEFYIVGGTSNLPKIKNDRKLYVIGTKWCKYGLFGKNMENKYDLEFDKLNKKEQLVKNLKWEIENVQKKLNVIHGWGRSPEGSSSQGELW